MKIIAKVGNFKSTKTAANWVSKARKQGHLLKVGTYIDREWDAKLPENVFCNGWKPAQSNMRHEFKATEYCLLFPDAEWERGPTVSNFREDATQIYNQVDPPVIYRVEMDCGTEDRAKVQGRVKHYLKHDSQLACTDKVLWVISSKYGGDENRVRELALWCEPLWPVALFTTLNELQVLGPHSRVWREFSRNGEEVTVTLRRIREKPWEEDEEEVRE